MSAFDDIPALPPGHKLGTIFRGAAAEYGEDQRTRNLLKAAGVTVDSFDSFTRDIVATLRKLPGDNTALEQTIEKHRAAIADLCAAAVGDRRP